MSPINPDSIKSSQESFAVELRKKHRNNAFQCKRAKQVAPQPSHLSPNLLEELTHISLISKDTRDNISKLFALIQHPDATILTLTHCYYYCFKLVLSKSEADIFFELGYIDKLLEDLKIDDAELIKQLTNLLINIASASPSNCVQLKNKGLIEILIWLIDHFSGEIRGNCIWCIRNLMHDCKEISEYLLGISFHKKAFGMIEDSYENSKDLYVILSLLCKQIVDVTEIESVICLFYRKISAESEDASILSILSGLFTISIHDSNRIDVICRQPRLVSVLVEFSTSPDHEIALAAFKVLGNISSSTSLHTQMLLDNNILPSITMNLYSSFSDLRKETYFTLSNIVAGAANQIKAAFEHDGLIKKAVQGVLDTNLEVRIEAWYVFKNIVNFRNKDFAMKLFDFGIANVITKALDIEKNVNVLETALKFCQTILDAGDIEGFNTVSQFFYGSGCFERISKLSNYENYAIANLAEEIIMIYYSFSRNEENY